MLQLKRILFHIKNSRPEWYRQYHQWKHHSTLHWITLSFSSLVILLGFVNTLLLTEKYSFQPANAASGTTTVTQQVNAGTLNISSQSSESMTAVTVNATTTQTTTGSLGTVTVTDDRGSGVGWSCTATSTDFYYINQAVKTSGSNSTVTSGGTYNTSAEGTYTITITTAGAVGTAVFSVSGLESATNQTTGSNVAIGTHGVTATFATATYAIGDSWTIRVDTIPITNLQVAPGSLTTISGSSTNVTAGSTISFANETTPITLLSASTAGGYGMGSYSVTPSLTLTIPAATYSDSYTATVTETVN